MNTRTTTLFAGSSPMGRRHFLSYSAALVTASAVGASAPSIQPHVVFVTGDEEYRSEHSMPMLAGLLRKHFGFKTSVCYAINKANGTIDPQTLDNIAGLEALETADLMVLFTRFRQLPEEQLRLITRFAASGKPIAGFRTSTHAFRYPARSPLAAEYNDTWPSKTFGQRWITHHGHFGDGTEFLTSVSLDPQATKHPIMQGVTPFSAYSWLYHVAGGGDQLDGQTTTLAIGKALKTSHAKETQRFPLENPVAWTKINRTVDGKDARVFFTTLGHPYDFKSESMRRLAIQGFLWAMERTDLIGTDGVPVDFAETYDPPNSGFGTHLVGRKPNA